MMIVRMHAILNEIYDVIFIMEIKLRFVGSPFWVAANVLDFDIVVIEFQIQSHNWVHTFRQMPLEKAMNLPLTPSYGLNITTSVIRQ